MTTITLEALKARAKKFAMSITVLGDDTYRLYNDDFSPMLLPRGMNAFTLKSLDGYLSAMEHSAAVGREDRRAEYPFGHGEKVRGPR